MQINIVRLTALVIYIYICNKLHVIFKIMMKIKLQSSNEISTILKRDLQPSS